MIHIAYEDTFEFPPTLELHTHVTILLEALNLELLCVVLRKLLHFVTIKIAKKNRAP